MKQIAVLLVSLAIIGIIVRLCFLPPPNLPGYVIGDKKCDICGEPAVYTLLIEGRYLAGEYCRTHRWFGLVHGAPWNTMTKILLGAALFGVIYSVTALLSGAKQPSQADDREFDERAPWRSGNV